jgi:putative peptidoglycan lipid II flippase
VPLAHQVTERMPRKPATPSLAKASGSMAIATLVSRVTGFVWKVLLAWAVGLAAVNGAFTVANTLPNIIYELLLGGVLSSVVVPLLVRAQDDRDGGREYTDRLLTVGMVFLAITTVLAIAAAPLFTSLFVDDSTGKSNSGLATAFAYLLLPEIFFYGLFALLQAVLNAKHLFGPGAWAPVLNNVVVCLTIGLYMVLPGDISLDPVRMGDPKLLTLGLGTTLGIVLQALVLIPPLIRSGYRFRWRWGLDARLREFGGLAGWMLLYVGVSQIGLVVGTRVLTAGDAGGPAIYANAWLLLQLPYGVIGVSLLTAILPRMSKAAADNDIPRLVGDLSMGSRLSTVLLGPLSAALSVAGVSVGLALFSLGKGGTEDAARLGLSLGASAFGLLPYALVMLQMRVFYAMKDSRTPTLIMVLMTAVKVPLLFMCSSTLAANDVVVGVMMVNSLTFVVGAVAGQMWLWVRLGNLQTKRVLRTIAVTTVASGIAMGVELLMMKVLGPALAGLGTVVGAWVTLIIQGMVVLVIAFGLLTLFRVEELKPATARITRLVRRG